MYLSVLIEFLPTTDKDSIKAKCTVSLLLVVNVNPWDKAKVNHIV